MSGQNSGEPVIAIILLTINQRETTLRALRSLVPDLPPRARMLVWDNGSDDCTVDAVAREFPQMTASITTPTISVSRQGGTRGAALAIEAFGADAPPVPR